MYWIKFTKYAFIQESRFKKQHFFFLSIIQVTQKNRFLLRSYKENSKVPISLCVCVFSLVLNICVIAAAILISLAILVAWLIYKVYRFLYPKTKLPELLKVYISCDSTTHYICVTYTTFLLLIIIFVSDGI